VLAVFAAQEVLPRALVVGEWMMAGVAAKVAVPFLEGAAAAAAAAGGDEGGGGGGDGSAANPDAGLFLIGAAELALQPLAAAGAFERESGVRARLDAALAAAERAVQGTAAAALAAGGGGGDGEAAAAAAGAALAAAARSCALRAMLRGGGG
jgi:hypothetical protein